MTDLNHLAISRKVMHIEAVSHLDRMIPIFSYGPCHRSRDWRQPGRISQHKVLLKFHQLFIKNDTSSRLGKPIIFVYVVS